MANENGNQNIDTHDDGPFPGAGEMGLELYQAGVRTAPVGAAPFRPITGPGGVLVARVYGDNDLLARRIEMIGDVYETLRKATDKMVAAGIDVSEEHEVLGLFVAPKPFSQVG